MHCVHLSIFITNAGKYGPEKLQIGTCQTHIREFFLQKHLTAKPLTVSAENSIIDVWQGYEYAFSSICLILAVKTLGRPKYKNDIACTV